VFRRTEARRLLEFQWRLESNMMKITGFLFVALALYAQAPNPAQQQPAMTPAETGQPMPIFRVAGRPISIFAVRN
jgi:hypothetical protein